MALTPQQMQGLTPIQQKFLETSIKPNMTPQQIQSQMNYVKGLQDVQIANQLLSYRPRELQDSLKGDFGGVRSYDWNKVTQQLGVPLNFTNNVSQSALDRMRDDPYATPNFMPYDQFIASGQVRAVVPSSSTQMMQSSPQAASQFSSQGLSATGQPLAQTMNTQQMPDSFLQGSSVGSTPVGSAQFSSTASPSVSTASTSDDFNIPSGFVSNVDPQIKKAFLENYEFAKGVANQPYQAYQGPRVAQFSGDQQLLFDKVRQMANQPQSFAAGNISQYMNPYQNEVINRFQTDLERQRQLADQNVNANAVSRGAFGGSRQAVAQSENTRNFMDTSARNLANLRAQGFDTAAQLMQSDINRANQGLNFLGQTGALQQGQVQRNYDTAYQDFLQQRDYPLKQLQIRGIGLGQSLPNFGIQQLPQAPQTNTAGNVLGGALIGSQIGSGFGSGFLGSNTGQIIGAIGGGLLGGFL